MASSTNDLPWWFWGAAALMGGAAVAAMLQPMPNPLLPAAQPAAPTHACPKCQSPVVTNAPFCPNCRTLLIWRKAA